MIHIGIVGDFSPEYPSHAATNQALKHSADKLGLAIEYEWLPTSAFIEEMDVICESYQGFWIGPGFPDSVEGILAVEPFRCNYGLHPDYLQRVHEAGLKVVGTDSAGNARIVELPEHPFYMGTLFVPQLRSTVSSTHCVVDAFLSAAWGVHPPNERKEIEKSITYGGSPTN